jgi:protein ImuA
MNKLAPSSPTLASLFASPAGGAVHEIHARAGDAGAVSGFGLAAAALAAEVGTVLWICPEFGSLEAGRPYGIGLHEYGLNPADFVIARTRSNMETLQAALEGARCPGLGAVLVEIWGEAAALDLTATRRLALGGEASGAQVFLLRVGARLLNPTAAYTRWRESPAPSRALAARAPGAPAFLARLERHRGGWPEQTFYLEWDRDARELRHADAGSSLSRAVAALSLGRNPPQPQPIQRAG